MSERPGRYRLRPARPRDLAALVQLARTKAIGISSLPTAKAALAEQIERSLRAFASDDQPSGEETYLFVLEDGERPGALAGTAAIAAAAGFNDRFYCYRNEFIVQAAPALGARSRIHTLHLCHDLTGVTLLTGFHVDAAYAGTLAPQLLSRGRLAFIAAHPQRFSDRIAAENPGLADDSGRCPFWDAIGRHFLDRPYAEAERLTGGRSPKAWIADLMPQTPVYVPLLPEEAQWALGQLHPVGELTFSILLDEGMDGDTYVNLFDGGPTAEGRVAALKTVSRLRPRRLAADAADATPAGPWWLVADGQGMDFAATLLRGRAGAALPLPEDAAQALGWDAGRRPQAARLDVEAAA